MHSTHEGARGADGRENPVGDRPVDGPDTPARPADLIDAESKQRPNLVGLIGARGHTGILWDAAAGRASCITHGDEASGSPNRTKLARSLG
jgi:hypothetical protein